MLLSSSIIILHLYLSEDNIVIFQNIMLGAAIAVLLLARAAAAAARPRVATSAAASRLLEKVPRLLVAVRVIVVVNDARAVGPRASRCNGAGGGAAGAFTATRCG